MKTIEDWRQYINTLSGEDLWSKAIAANSTSFMDSLRRDGFSSKDITEVMLSFARRMVEEAMKPPGGGFMSYEDLIENDDVLRRAYHEMLSQGQAGTAPF